MEGPAEFVRRAVGAASRRLDRPELLAAFYPRAAQILREEVAMGAILAGALRGDSTYVDVGTNRGQVLRDAVRLAPHGRHIAFEPIPALADELVSAFPGVDCRRLAVGAAPGTAEFCHFTELDGWSGLRRSPQISDERGRPQYIEVQVSTLDVELRDVSPSVVKIDVEGAELEVLRGACEVLARARPVVIFEHDAAAAQLYEARSEVVWDALEQLGYRVFTVTGEGPIERGAFGADASAINWLATPDTLAAG
jgi:FkbM family methyltransferase